MKAPGVYPPLGVGNGRGAWWDLALMAGAGDHL